MDLIANSVDLFIQHYLIGFYKRGKECLLHSSNWVFKSDGYSFVLKGLTVQPTCA